MNRERDARRANHRLYESGAEVAAYLQHPYHAVRIRIARRLLVEHLAGPRPVVLELGGRTTLPEEFRTVSGDIELAALTPPNAVCLDAAGLLPIADGAVDGILMGELIEHVYDTRRLLDECHRVLRPAGLLVITTPNLATLQDRVRFLAGRSPRQVDPLHHYLSVHIRPFTAGKLVEVLAQCGFRTRRLASNHVVWRFGAGRELHSRLLARLFPTLGGSLICAAVRSG